MRILIAFLVAAVIGPATPLLAEVMPSATIIPPATAIPLTAALAPAPAQPPVSEIPSALELPSATADASTNDLAAPIGQLIDNAIADRLIAGGVAVVGNRDGILFSSARGRLDATVGAPPIDINTIFDLASLTKVIATAPAIMKLVDEGRLALTDPISRWYPAFGGRHGDITIINLLTHTSGLEDRPVRRDESMATVIRRAAAERHRPRPGSHFEYADINFIILGDLVHRITGERLDEFCRNELYLPMNDTETMFLPPSDLDDCIAPTVGTTLGTVQDPDSRRLGGVAGNAGLFSSAYDLSRFARMLLGGGVLEGKRILSKEAIAKMTTPYYCSSREIIRTPGWDVDTLYSAPKGKYFSECSFGHTGYSGTSIWIDPKLDLFVILLTNRLDYRDVTRFNQLRRDVSTVALAELEAGGADRAAELTSSTPAAAPVVIHRLPHLKTSCALPPRPHLRRHATRPRALRCYRRSRVMRRTSRLHRRRTRYHARRTWHRRRRR